MKHLNRLRFSSIEPAENQSGPSPSLMSNPALIIPKIKSCDDRYRSYIAQG